MPARSTALFHCHCESCDAEGGNNPDGSPRGKSFSATHRVAHMNTIRLRSMSQATSASSEQVTSRTSRSNMEGASNAGRDFMINSDREGAQSSSGIQDASSRSDVQDIIMGSDIQDVFSSMTLQAHPPSSRAGRATAKREAHHLTSRCHALLDLVEKRANECFQQLTDIDLDFEQVPTITIEIGHIQKAFDGVKRNVDSVISRKSEIGKSLQTFKRPSHHVKRNMTNVRTGNLCILTLVS